MARTAPAVSKPTLKQQSFIEDDSLEPSIVKIPKTGKSISNGRGAPDDFSRLTVNLPKDMHKKLKIKAAMDERNIGDIIREKVAEYLKG